MQGTEHSSRLMGSGILLDRTNAWGWWVAGGGGGVGGRNQKGLSVLGGVQGWESKRSGLGKGL